MKKVFILLSWCLLFSACSLLRTYPFAHAQYIDGYWGAWKKDNVLKYTGSPGDFVVYTEFNHPSEYTYKVTITNYNDYLVKKNKSVEFEGFIEYRFDEIAFRNRDYTELGKHFISTLGYGGEKSVKRPATILVGKEGTAYVYNIYFDNVGLSVQIPW